MIDEIPFGEFLPDAPSYKNPGLVACENVWAIGAGYDPIRALSSTGNSIASGDVRGAWRAYLQGGDSLLIVGTDTDLHVLRDEVFYASGLALTLDAGETWAFDRFGADIYASTKSSGMFRLVDVLTSNTFVAASGSPPKAAALDTVGDFLMTGNLEDVDASDQPYRVRWSSFNNPTAAWDTDIGRQSGYIDFPTRYGVVTGIFGNGFDLVFQERGVSRIWYTGGATVFAKKEIEEDRGCPAPNSVCRVGGYLYFLASDGFCRTDGSSVEVISSDRVWSWFLDNLAQELMDKVQGVVNWSKRSVVWSFHQDGRGFTRQIIYNFGLDRWSTASIEVDWLIEGSTAAVSVDELDAGLSGDDVADTDGPSFDDARYRAEARSIMAMKDQDLCAFLGGNLEARFVTGDFQRSPTEKSYLTAVTPLIESLDRPFLASAGGRDRPGGIVSWTARKAQGSHGFCPIVSDARFHAVEVVAPFGAEWGKAQGVQVDWTGSGYA